MSETQAATEVVQEVEDDLDAFSETFYGQKKVQEVKPADDDTTEADAAQDPDPSEAPEDAEAQKAKDDALDEAEAQEEIPDKPKRKTVQERIDEVVRQREDVRREAAAEAAKLRQELDDLKKRLDGPAQPAAQAAAEPVSYATNADGEPIYPLGEFDPQYIRDLTRYTLQEERAKVRAEMAETQRQTALQSEQQTLRSTWDGRVQEATKEYPDFIEKGTELLNGFNNIDPNYAGYLSTVLMTMDKGPDVLYYLSNHPDEAAAIVNSGAQKATLALGRIESRFLQSEQAAAKPRVSKAPVPAPARAQARGTNGAFVSVAPDTDDLEAFEQEFFKPRKF